MAGITIKLTRRILDGHLMYDLDGNLKPIPCGSMVETKIKDYFKGKTGERIPREGFFFRIIDRENHPQLHAVYYREQYGVESIASNIQSPGREIKFIDLQPTDRLFYAIKNEDKGGVDGLVEEYKDIQKIIASVDDEEEILMIQLSK